jgi:MFS family permease
LFGAVAAVLLVPRSRDLLARVRFDWAGLGIFFPAMVALLCAISFGATSGWGSPLIVSSFAVAAVLFIVFMWHERRDSQPMLDLALFRNRRFSSGIASGMGSYLVMFGVLLVVPFYFERALGLGTARSGLELMVFPVAFGVVAPFAGRVADRVGARPLCVGGMAVVTVALVLLGALRPSTGGFLVLLACLGVGMGLFTSPNNASIMGAAPEQQAGMASGVLNMTRGLGTALGLAVTGTIFTVAGGDIVKAGGAAADAAHAFSVTAYVLAGIAAAAGIVAALRSVGTLRYAKLSSIE